MGCGLCEGLSKNPTNKMQLLSDGFLHPGQLNADEEILVDKICPGKNVLNSKTRNSNRVWGNILQLYVGSSTDNKIRKVGSSGGIVSALAIYMLEKGIVDAVLQVGSDKNNYKNNELKVSRSRDEVLRCSSSRYAPANIFCSILEILKQTNETFCFVGKPCDISALTNLLNEYPEFKEKIKLTVAIFCAGIPSINATEKLIDMHNSENPIHDLAYRGDGWPGSFRFTDKSGKTFKTSYNDSWGKVLGKELHFRCKICPDGIGLQSDIAVGDAWDTADGYPDFEEKDGKSFMIARTGKAEDILKQCYTENFIEMKPLGSAKLKSMQPYQYQRRKVAGARVLAYQLANKRTLNFRGLNLFSNCLINSPLTLFREFKGTYRRTKKQIC